jgi:hypothetical protein
MMAPPADSTEATPAEPVAEPEVEPSAVELDMAAIAALEAAQRAANIAAAQRQAVAIVSEATQRDLVATIELDRAAQQATTATAAHLAQQQNYEQAKRAVVAARERVSGLGLGSYVNATSESSRVLQAQLAALDGSGRVNDALAITAYMNSAGSVLLGRLERALSARSEASDELARTEEASGTAAARLRLATVEQEAARQGRVDADVNAAWVVANAEQLSVTDSVFCCGPDPAGGLSVLGKSVVNAEDLASFVRSRGKPHPSIDLTALAQAFLDEGADEGVRGDVAFMQSILETGYFSFRKSMVDPEDYNYAGIGACDSCSDGFGFGSMKLGVRAQMQLLHAYANPSLTEATLAHPRVRTNPDRLSVRGCCDTWMELSGVWATGDGYGQKILGLYNALLSHAVNRRAVPNSE